MSAEAPLVPLALTAPVHHCRWLAARVDVAELAVRIVALLLRREEDALRHQARDVLVEEIAAVAGHAEPTQPVPADESPCLALDYVTERAQLPHLAVAVDELHAHSTTRLVHPRERKLNGKVVTYDH